MSSSSPVAPGAPSARAAGTSSSTAGRAASAGLTRLAVLAALVGAAAGLSAWVLYSMIAFASNLIFLHRWSWAYHDVTHHLLGGWVLIVPALGGLVVGLMAKYGTPKIRGHGIPEAMEAVLFNRSRIAPRVAVLKPLSVAVAIGTGGPFGAEGPIIQTGGALGSILGQALHLTAAERKVLLASGAAAGMAATFNTPIAAVILAIELLLFEYKARSFVPLVIASTLATTVRFALMGRSAMFSMPPADFGVPAALPAYLVLGIVCGLAAVGFSKALYWIEDGFERLPVDEVWWPVLGGLGLGVIGFFVPRVLGIGYGSISDILAAHLAIGALAVLLLAKAAALLVSLGSGTSGGLLAPLFMVGAALGGLYADAVNALVPSLALSPSACALVAMAAMFGAAARAPFTFIIFAFEITRDYNAVLPLMLVGVVAYAVALRLAKHSIMTEKLARRGLLVPQEYEVDPFQRRTVGQTMSAAPAVVPADLATAELAARIARREPAVTQHQALLLVDGQGELAGVITRGDLVRALERDPTGGMTVLEAGTRDPVVAFPDETLHEAIVRMLEQDVGRLPVVSREQPRRIVGYLGRAAILDVRRQVLAEEHVREPGWLRAAARTDPS
ncbi:MAG TPA: chloride channel protein [Opitutaceae bacterium]|nr:chloride channel protein [Opitutaceae bacterium]